MISTVAGVSDEERKTGPSERSHPGDGDTAGAVDTGCAVDTAGAMAPVAQVTPRPPAPAPADTVQGESDHLVAAVDALETMTIEPVDTHATRYREVHTLLQDALSATDRPGD